MNSSANESVAVVSGGTVTPNTTYRYETMTLGSENIAARRNAIVGVESTGLPSTVTELIVTVHPSAVMGPVREVQVQVGVNGIQGSSTHSKFVKYTQSNQVAQYQNIFRFAIITNLDGQTQDASNMTIVAYFA